MNIEVGDLAGDFGEARVVMEGDEIGIFLEMAGIVEAECDGQFEGAESARQAVAATLLHPATTSDRARINHRSLNITATAGNRHAP